MVLPGLVLVGKDSLAFVDSRFTRRPDGSVVWHGTRPGPDWHKHDFPTRRSSMLDGGEVKEVLLLRRRWKLKGTNTTQLDRVPDEIPLVRACTLVVLLTLWAWLDGDAGLENHTPVFDDLALVRSTRQIQRWLTRATARAMRTQQQLRHALIERCEPRPVEQLFPGGLSPPEGLLRRRWSQPPQVERLWRGLTIAVRGSVKLKTPVPTLLAEARGRLPGEPTLL